ncbi:restriction endonuclease subunit S [Lactiplantibacillus plantarum]|uniref:restriction endonuclease subunit S n=1 Tax=Lactiplantibacillus plantarum TaxID=1590 RepID=UPI003F533B68
MKDNQAKYPQLRFKGFTDPWVQRNLGDVVENQYNGQTPSRNNPDFWGGEIPWLTSGELNHGIVNNTVETITVAGQKDANLKIVPAGTFVMAITGLEAPGTRGNSSILGFDTTVNQSVMALFPNEKLDTQFLFQWYQKVGEEYGISYTQGTKQQSYNAELIKILPFTLPDNVEEQQRIAKLLFKLDDLIAANQRKLDLLKEQKKGYLQKMFPKNGAKVPELRFAGFADAWEERKLGDYVIIRSGWSPSNFDINNNANNLFIKVDDLNYSTRVQEESQVKVNILSKYKKMKKSSTIFPKRGAAIMTNKVRMLGEDSYMDTNMMALEPKGIDPEYLYTFINKTGLYKIADTSTIPQINNKHIEPYLLLIPSLEEQHKIGSFFKQLDGTIALHQRKLEKLQELKKGYLQKMFC